LWGNLRWIVLGKLLMVLLLLVVMALLPMRSTDRDRRKVVMVLLVDFHGVSFSF